MRYSYFFVVLLFSYFCRVFYSVLVAGISMLLVVQVREMHEGRETCAKLLPLGEPPTHVLLFAREQRQSLAPLVSRCGLYDTVGRRTRS